MCLDGCNVLFVASYCRSSTAKNGKYLFDTFYSRSSAGIVYHRVGGAFAMAMSMFYII